MSGTLPRRYLPSIASLRAIEALDRLGSATAAAEDLSLTQSAVSRQLQQLEEQLGISLIQRDKRQMNLTETGRQYASDIRGALQSIAKASMGLHSRPGAKGLSLAILPSFGMRWLVPRLAHFAQLHPDVPVNLSTRLTDVEFDADGFDAAILYGDGYWPDAQALKLADEQVIPVCSPALAKSSGFETAADLTGGNLLHIATRPDAWDDWLRARGAPPPVRSGALFDQFSAITQAAIHGLGVALLPDFIAKTELSSGKLKSVVEGYSPSLNGYYLVWPKHKATDPALLLFREWIETQTEDNLPR